MGTAISTSAISAAYPETDVYRVRSDSRPANQSSAKSPSGTSESDSEAKGYHVSISEEALRKAGLIKETPASKEKKPSTDPKIAEQISKMQRTDREVRSHEQAHVAAGGSLVRGAASFGYKSGPDGKLYAVSGEVSIDMSPVDGDPQATIRKMAQVTKAALAPAQPSGQDRAIAAAAMKIMLDAQAAVATQQSSDSKNKMDSG